MPGHNALTLADDSVLEVRVPIDSRDARQWLRFKNNPSSNRDAWFNGLEQVECRLRWTEDKENHVYTGRIHRAVEFNRVTRTLTVAIRLNGKDAVPDGPASLPLVDGMFCTVEIPGRRLGNVFRLPRWSVTFDNTVYVSAANRLRTVPVRVARISGEEAFISGGIKAGDIVVITRLVNPLEGSLLDFTLPETGDAQP